MAGEQVFIGLTTSGLCAVGLIRDGWFLSETQKGRRLVEWCGSLKALWILRLLFAVGVLFGLALATGVVNPVRWDSGANASPEPQDEPSVRPAMLCRMS